MKTIQQIIQDKMRGVDCTEEESAEIKGFLRELKFVGQQKIVADIQEHFPIEYGEYLDEAEPEIQVQLSAFELM